ncbi:hypothetical protein F4861DRAFT_540483 [Xylaria intraflava]|nr:hypothetical protein F4861DRAFT_540483 [Xylaria intraflava]
MLRTRANRLAILAQIEHKAAQKAAERRHMASTGVDDDSGDDADFADFATDFDEVELNQQLQQMRDGSNMLFDLPETTLDGDVIETAQDEELPSLDELQQLADFQNIGGENENDGDDYDDDSLSEYENEDGYDDSALDVEMQWDSSPKASGSMSTSRKRWDAEDISEALPHRRHPELLSNIHMALGVWAQLNGITDRTYQGLKEILQTQITADTLGDIASLPISVRTLKASMRRRLPLIEMRKASIPLQAGKMPTARLLRKPGQIPKQDLYFFNCVEYLKTLLASDIKGKMYFGLALMVDDEDKSHPWHSRAWASSARSTSGQFARLPSDNSVIIPSDFVEFDCHKEECPTCHSPQRPDVHHQGRVSEVWRDERSKPLTTRGEVILRIEPMIRLDRFKAALCSIGHTLKGYPSEDIPENEYVIAENEPFLISETNIIKRIESVYIDYTFGSDVHLPEDSIGETYRPLADILIRRKVNTKLKRFFPIVKSPPIRAELEVNEFTRDAIVRSLARQDVEVYSVPLILFADGFGLYRTMHKSIMGIYTGIASLARSDRFRQMNVMPLTLGPHASNDDDVWKQIGHSLRDVENGVSVDLHGIPSFIHAHVIFLAGDFPQQQENSGFRRPTAKQGCRMCDVTLTDRGDLNFDLTSGEHERHHHEIMRQRALMNLQVNKARTNDVANRYGLAVKTPMLLNVLPALDIIKSRPADTAHSELAGLTKMIHLLVIDQVLTPVGNTEYAKIIRLFPLHPGWLRIQSPQHVLQYSLTEHGRWSVVAPIIFRTWLKSNPQYVKVTFKRAIMDVFAADIASGVFGTNVEAIDILIRVLVANVTTNILLTTDKLPVIYRQHDMRHFDDQIKYSRHLFQQFCKATAASVASRRSMSAAPSVMAANLPTVASGTSGIETGPEAVSAAIVLQSTEEIEDPHTAMESVEITTAKSTKYKLWMSRPNVHIGLHYRDVLEEYCLPSLPMVIVFEIKHKLWKKMVYTTNHRVPEKDLFSWENIAQTMRFVILNSHAESDGELTIQMQDLNKAAPSLFTSIMRGQAMAGDDNEEEMDTMTGGHRIMAHASYIEASVGGLIKAQARQNLGLPARESHMDVRTRQLLEVAYARDYGRQVTMMGTSQRLKWWQSVTWSSRDEVTKTVDRTTKRGGQYIEYIDDRHANVPGGDKPPAVYGRVDHIFSHAAVFGDEASRVFIMVSPVEKVTVDPYTGLDVYKLQPSVIIGLPALLQKAVYMVPFKEDGTNGNWTFISDFDRENRDQYRLLHINWDVGFM